MRSLGRARGFEVSARFSALGDEELMDMISSRCHAILKIVGEEVTEELEDTGLEEQLRDEIVELQKAADGYEEEMDGLLAQVNEALSEVYEEEFIYLEDAVEALIVEYHEAMEETEEEEDEDEGDIEDEDDYESLSELDKVILLLEQDEVEAEGY